MVEYESLIGYDGVNLLSDVGGTLGLFMGWSIAYCTDIIAKFFKRKTIRSIFISIIMLILMIGFIQWSTPIFYRFAEEVETVEFRKEKSLTFPYVTICPVQAIFFEKH